jgi:protein-L-isoaspartate(D-aspartate) O-methyltransferase
LKASAIKSLSEFGCVAILACDLKTTIHYVEIQEPKMRNIEQARFNMVEQQIRPWDVHDPKVLELLMKVKREHFVPADGQALALMDLEIALGHGEVMWAPKIEARAVQALKLMHTDRVLEVGTGSGYVTALLAHLAAQVTSVELVPELAQIAEQKMLSHHLKNVTVAVGNAAQGWADQQYDAIVITASLPVKPVELLQQLKVGGRLFLILWGGSAKKATLFTRVTEDAIDSVVLFETSVAPLLKASQPERFVF